MHPSSQYPIPTSRFVISRRRALQLFAGGGLAVALLPLGGSLRSLQRAAARDNPDDQEQAAMVPFEMTVREGPSTGTAYAGVLRLFSDPNGTAIDGTLITDDGGEIAVHGDTDGQNISLQFDLGDGTTISGTGTSTMDVRLGSGGEIGGTFTGPLDDDAGDWSANGTLVVDSNGNVYLSDPTRQIISMKPDLFSAASRYAGTNNTAGYVDAPRLQSRMNQPYGMTINGSGTLYFADTANHVVRRVGFSSGNVTTLLRASSASGVSIGTFGPRGLALDPGNALYISDNINQVIWKSVLGSGTMTVLAGAVGQAGRRDGTGSAARFNMPDIMDIFGSGSTAILNVVDAGNNIVRQITSDGQVASIGSVAVNQT